jgi:hypothetical protein
VKQQLSVQHMTISDLKEQLQQNNDIPEKILYFGANHNTGHKELKALIQFQINEGNGLPSFFTTGSCAEFYFKALHKLSEIYTFETTGENIDLMNRNTLFSLLQNNTIYSMSLL